MRRNTSSSAGTTLIEILVILIVLALLASLATPAFVASVDGMRARATLSLISAEMYRVRMLAVRSGYPARLILHSRPDGCVGSVRVVVMDAGIREHSSKQELELPGLCLEHNGDSVFVFNARGLLRPPGRTLRIGEGTKAPRVVISVAGRVRRAYRRARRG